MQENNSGDFDKIVPVQETGEKEPPSCKARVFSPLFCVGAVVPKILLEVCGPTPTRV